MWCQHVRSLQRAAVHTRALTGAQHVSAAAIARCTHPLVASSSSSGVPVRHASHLAAASRSSGLLLPQAGLHRSAIGSAQGADSSNIINKSGSTSGGTIATPSSSLITPQAPSASQILTSANTAGTGSHLSDLSDDDPSERDPRMLDCILVRHGESEGNIAYNRSWEGDHSLYTGAFLKRHSSLWRLTDRGREQAKTAGEWLRTHASAAHLDPSTPGAQYQRIYRYYVSEYIRAMETAALMELPDAKWFVEVQLRERDWGTFDIMSQKERVVRFSEETRRRDRDSLFYAPPGGESLVHVLSRVDGVLTNFNRQCANRRCIVVCHGEVMWAFRLRFERLSQLTYREMEAASSPYERIHNCQILWYSRRNPYTGEISKFFKWKRSVCPWDLKRSHNEWEEIVRVEHTNESLLAHVNRVKRIYGHEKSYRASTMPPERAAALALAKSASATNSQSSITSSTPTLSDPLVAAEISSLKTDDPVMAAAAAATTDDPSLRVPPPPPRAALTTPPPSPSPAALTPAASNIAAAAAATEVASTAAASAAPNVSVELDPASEDAHLPLGRVPNTVGAEVQASAQVIAAVKAVGEASGSTPHVGGPPGMNASSSSASAANSTGSADDSSVVPAPPAAWTPPPGWPFLSAHPRVLVLTKTPRYEHEKNSSGLRGQDLHAELSKLGFVSDRLVQSYVRHMEGLAQLTMALQQHSMKVIVKHVDSATHADLEGIDLILSAGGDGTMLKAAALLGYQQPGSSAATHMGKRIATHNVGTDNSTDDMSGPPAHIDAPTEPAPTSSSTHAAVDGSTSSSPTDEAQPFIPIPLIGVNTDPQHSSGVLCAFSIEGPHTAVRVIEHLRKSHFVWVEKSRIEITLIDKSGVATPVGQYAYNDVVVAERDPGRPIVYELTVDDHAAEIQRSSGVLVCTGTGSTAWMANAAGMHPDQVAAVLKDVGYKHSMADARSIAERINMDLVFESNSPEVEYFVREPLLPLSSSAGASVGRVGYQHRHGWAGRVAVRSLGWDAVMSIDGINLIQLPKGTTAVLHIGKRPGANLMVLSLAGTGGEPFSRQ